MEGIVEDAYHVARQRSELSVYRYEARMSVSWRTVDLLNLILTQAVKIH
jgi:hypothetical protein